MKKKILLLVVGITLITFTYGQTLKDAPISVVSPHKDTLYLANNDVGYMIQEVWEENYENGYYGEEKPIIIFKSPDWIIRENNLRNKERHGTESNN